MNVTQLNRFHFDQNGWISGYGFCIFCFVQLQILCILGTYVNDQVSALLITF